MKLEWLFAIFMSITIITVAGLAANSPTITGMAIETQAGSSFEYSESQDIADWSQVGRDYENTYNYPSSFDYSELTLQQTLTYETSPLQPLVRNNALYVVSGTTIYGYDLTSLPASQLFKASVPEVPRSSLTITDAGVYVGYGSKSGVVRKLNPLTGTTIWTSGEGIFTGEIRQISVIDENVLVADESGKIYSIDTYDGSLNWQHEGLGADVKNSFTLADDRFIVITESRALALDYAGSMKWESDLGGTILAPPIITGSTVSFVAEGKIFRTLNLADGSVACSGSLSADGTSGMTYNGNDIIIASRSPEQFTKMDPTGCKASFEKTIDGAVEIQPISTTDTLMTPYLTEKPLVQSAILATEFDLLTTSWFSGDFGYNLGNYIPILINDDMLIYAVDRRVLILQAVETFDSYDSNAWMMKGRDLEHTATATDDIDVSFLGEKWSYATGHDIFGSVIDESGNVYFVDYYEKTGEATLYALDADGNKLWSTLVVYGEKPVQIMDIPTVTTNGLVLVSTERGIIAYDTNDGTLAWFTEKPASRLETAPVVKDSVIIVGASEHVLAYNLADGSLKWSYAKGTSLEPAIDDDTVYVLTRDGFFLSLNLADGSLGLLDSKKLAFSTNPVIADLTLKETSYPVEMYGSENSVYIVDRNKAGVMTSLSTKFNVQSVALDGDYLVVLGYVINKDGSRTMYYESYDTTLDFNRVCSNSFKNQRSYGLLANIDGYSFVQTEEHLVVISTSTCSAVTSTTTGKSSSSSHYIAVGSDMIITSADGELIALEAIEPATSECDGGWCMDGHDLEQSATSNQSNTSLDPTDLAVDWSYDVSGFIYGVVVDTDGTSYVVAQVQKETGVIYAFDAEGELLWSSDLLDRKDYVLEVIEGMVIAGDHLLIPTESCIVAYDKETGDFVMQSEQAFVDGKVSYTILAPLVVSDNVVLVTTPSFMFGLDVTDLTTSWSKEFSGTAYEPLVLDGYVYAFNSARQLVKMDVASGAVSYTAKAYDGLISTSPFLGSDEKYTTIIQVGSSEKSIGRFDPATGTIVGKIGLSYPIQLIAEDDQRVAVIMGSTGKDGSYVGKLVVLDTNFNEQCSYGLTNEPFSFGLSGDHAFVVDTSHLSSIDITTCSLAETVSFSDVDSYAKLAIADAGMFMAADGAVKAIRTPGTVPPSTTTGSGGGSSDDVLYAKVVAGCISVPTTLIISDGYSFVSGAMVKITSGEEVYNGMTNSQGVYELLLPQGSYSLQVTKGSLSLLNSFSVPSCVLVNTTSAERELLIEDLIKEAEDIFLTRSSSGRGTVIYREGDDRVMSFSSDSNEEVEAVDASTESDEPANVLFFTSGKAFSLFMLLLVLLVVIISMYARHKYKSWKKQQEMVKSKKK